MPVLLWLIPVTLISAGWYRWSQVKPRLGAPVWRSVLAICALALASIQCLWLFAIYAKRSTVPGFAIDPGWFFVVGRFNFWLFVSVVLLLIPSRAGARIFTLIGSFVNFALWFVFSMAM